MTDTGCVHQAIETGSGPAAARPPALKLVNIALGNVKAALTGPCRAIGNEHVPRTLTEFEYRFNWRCDLAAMVPRLCWAGVRTASMLHQSLKQAEV